jgi:DNA repair protein RadC
MKAKNKKDNIHAKHRQRMFDKAFGDVKQFADHELLEMFLYLANAQKDTNKIAHNLLRQFGNFKGVLSATIEQLTAVDGVGQITALYIRVFGEMFYRTNMQTVPVAKLNTSEKLEEYLKAFFSYEQVESLYAICLNKHFSVVANIKLSELHSTANDATVNVDVALAKMVSAGAKIVVLAHNHLVDDVTPTQEDVHTTKIFLQKMTSIGIVLHDHIIVNADKIFSFAKQGWIDIWQNHIGSSKIAFDNKTKVASGGFMLADFFGLRL